MQMDGDVFVSTMVVKIDDLLRKQKYNRGKHTKKTMSVRTCGTKNKKNRLPVSYFSWSGHSFPIIAHVKSGTMIWSDEWKAYHNLCDEGYDHGSVSHKFEFKSKDGVCTNTIEGSFNAI